MYLPLYFAVVLNCSVCWASKVLLKLRIEWQQSIPEGETKKYPSYILQNTQNVVTLRVYLVVRTCEVFLCFVAIVRVRVYHLDFFVLRHWWVLQFLTPMLSPFCSVNLSNDGGNAQHHAYSINLYIASEIRNCLHLFSTPMALWLNMQRLCSIWNGITKISCRRSHSLEYAELGKFAFLFFTG